VLADGEVIASRNKSWLKRLLGQSWPDADEVIAKLSALS